jgi:hypothetical protein
MMAPPPPPQPRTGGPKWLWVALIVVLAFALVVVLFNPSGDRDGTVEDPIVMPDTGEGVGVGQDPAPNDTTPPPEPFAPGGDPAQ